MTDENHNEENERTWKNYIPLMVLVGLSLLMAGAVTASASPSRQTFSVGMHTFMGLFLVIFSMFKFFNLPGFADGFQMYDLLAKRFRPYALLYPFLELGLGLAYLAEFYLPAVYIATMVLMTFGALGVLHALRKDLKINCACMGTVLDVPLSTVALVEDLGMTAMAVTMLFMS